MRRHNGAASTPARLGTAAMPIAVARGLAAEDECAAGTQDAMKLAESAVEVGDVMKDRVAEDEIEALIGERQRFRLGARRGDVEAQAPGARAKGREHAGGDVGRGYPLDQSQLEQVEREVAGP